MQSLRAGFTLFCIHWFVAPGRQAARMVGRGGSIPSTTRIRAMASDDTQMPTMPMPTVMQTSKAEEGPVKGEAWAVLRALVLLVGGLLLVGYLIG